MQSDPLGLSPEEKPAVVQFCLCLEDQYGKGDSEGPNWGRLPGHILQDAICPIPVLLLGWFWPSLGGRCDYCPNA